MSLSVTSVALASAAGALSTLSPCVIPLIPIVISTATSAHRFGPYGLAAGLTISYAMIGALLASVGHLGFIDNAQLRMVAAASLTLIGIQLLFSRVQDRLGVGLARMADVGQRLVDRIPNGTLAGQVLIGTLLGVVWSPCVGPTLGAAVTLASQGGPLSDAMVQMGAFGVGASIPLLAIGLLSRKAFLKTQNHLLFVGTSGKKLLGAITVVLGASVLLGLDKRFEAWLVESSPQWLLDLTTSI